MPRGATKPVPTTVDIASTSLFEALNQIKKMTVSSELPEGMPYYLAPTGPAFTNVSIHLKRVRLRTALRLLLNQVGRTFRVEDGLVIVAP